MSEPQLRRFRDLLYQHLNNRADALMDLLDALSSNTDASSVVELSLNPLFRRGHDSVYAAIAALDLSPEARRELLRSAIPQEQKRAFWLLGVDVTSHPRPYARTLEDRTMVYAPTVVKGNKPVTIGHRYSMVFLHPEREPQEPPWVVPLDECRVKSDEDAELVGAEQLRALLDDPRLPFHRHLSVIVGDTRYSKPDFLLAFKDRPNVVIIARVRSTRVFYRRYRPDADTGRQRGHPRWYGAPFALNDPQTWPEPDEEITISTTTRKGKPRQIRLRLWRDMVMRGSRKHPMHRHPFTLLSVEWLTPEGKRLYKHPLWLLLFGPRRKAVTAQEAMRAYQQRFDGEHYFRFAKRRLLLTATQTPEAAHEEHWWLLVRLAYLQLWLARDLAKALWHPWQRYLARQPETVRTPSQVQRDFSRIIRQIGTPARMPKRRGKSPGWQEGVQRKPRLRRKVVLKS